MTASTRERIGEDFSYEARAVFREMWGFVRTFRLLERAEKRKINEDI